MSYANWSEELLDMEGKKRGFSYDAYGRIIQVNEYNKANKNGDPTTDFQTYSTKYTYGLLGNLLKITDAEGNIREFKYDTFSRRIALTDLHYPTKTDFGSYYFVYDNNGNLTGKIAPSKDETKYEYDALSRITKEDLVYSSGKMPSSLLSLVDGLYYYDSTVRTTSTLNKNVQNYGIGKLAKVVSRDINFSGTTGSYFGAVSMPEYDKLGNVIKETKEITLAIFLNTVSSHHTFILCFPAGIATCKWACSSCP